MREHQFRRPDGPLGPFADGYRRHLLALGYTPASVGRRLTQFAAISRWLASEGHAAGDLDEAAAVRFAASRAANGRSTWSRPATMRLPLAYLRAAGIVAPRGEPGGRFGELLVAYRGYLRDERGLADKTVAAHLHGARRFLAAVLGEERELEGLHAWDVTAYVVSTCAELPPTAARHAVGSLSSLLRYLHVAGTLAASLTFAVPKLARQRSGPPPPSLTRAEMSRLLASCDRRRAAGRRDYAVVLLCSRLGLRPCEVAALTLDDLDWHHGEVLVRGKGGRLERLPLPVDVGAALVGYLERGRPRRAGTGRVVFLRARAPFTPLGFVGVQAVVQNASRRAGLRPFGPRRLRQHAASEMNRSGTALVGVAEVLRHHDIFVTTVYVDVAPGALSGLARPWPGGEA